MSLWGRSARVTFESLLSHSNSFLVSVELEARRLHKAAAVRNSLLKSLPANFLISQEDENGEKLTMKKWWICGADFSRFTQSFLRFIRDINGEKNISRYR